MRRGEETRFSQVFIVVLIGYLPSKLAQNRRGIRRIDNEMQKKSPAAPGVRKTSGKQASLGFSGRNFWRVFKEVVY